MYAATTFLLIIAGGDYREGDIRLVGGVYSWEGRVEIYLHGEWVTITGSDQLDAHVVCRQLGYDTRCESIIICSEHSLYIISCDISDGTSDRSVCCSTYGNGLIHIRYPRCYGSESRLMDCGFLYLIEPDNSRDDWSVICSNGKLKHFHTLLIRLKLILRIIILYISDAPNTEEVRLYYNYNNPSYYRGRVEVYIAGVWGTVAGDWTLENAEVVCRQLGFEIPRT